MSAVPVAEKLYLFQKMLACTGGPRLEWYDGMFRQISDKDENSNTVNALLSLCRRGVNLEAFLAEKPEPFLFTGRISLLWILCPVLSENTSIRICSIGPILSESLSAFSLDTALANAGASLTLRGQASVLLRSLPVLPYDRIWAYAAMLFYLVSGNSLEINELRLLHGGSLPSGIRKTFLLDDRQAYEAEQETLRRVREGDASLCSSTDLFALGEAVLRTKLPGDQLRQMKNDTIARLTLLSRAAVTGGISLETSNSLWSKYAQSVEVARSGGELIGLLQIMQEDFTRRVHVVKSLKMSREIESACNYIEQHLEDPLSIKTLAALNGYAEYYFSRKFRREAGMSPAEYIRTKRLQKAAILLLTTEQSVKEIGASLQFCSHSFFSDCFQRKYGVTPSQYRRAAMP